MFKILKYLIYTIIIIPVVFFIALYTPWGNNAFYGYINKLANKKSKVLIEIKQIDIFDYPTIKIKAKIDKEIFARVQGKIDIETRVVDINYTLKTNFIHTKEKLLRDKVNIRGNISGHIKNLFIVGKGKLLEGSVEFNTTKEKKDFKNTHLKLTQINVEKLFKIFNEKPYLKDKANIYANFSLINKKHQKGFLTYESNESKIFPLTFQLLGRVDVNDSQHKFNINLTHPSLKLQIQNGRHNHLTKVTKATYILNVSNLTPFKPILKKKYQGSFYARGEILNKNHQLQIRGSSKTFAHEKATDNDGWLDFLFRDDILTLQLDNLSFSKITHLFSLPKSLTAQTYGSIIYDINHKKFTVKTKLKNLTIMHPKLVKKIYSKLKFNLSRTLFTQGLLNFTFQNGMGIGELKLQNKKEHIFITNAKIDTYLNTINSYFDFNVQQQALSGKIYGSLDKPKLNFSMQKLIEYQMEKQMDNFMGTGNRKMIEGMPMGDEVKDVATDVASDFMKMIF